MDTNNYVMTNEDDGVKEYDAQEFTDRDAAVEQINKQINDAINDACSEGLTEADPEYARLKEVIRDQLPSGNGAAILLAAARAGREKTQRLADESKQMTTQQLFRSAYAKPATTTMAKAPPPAEQMTGRQMLDQAYKKK